MSLKGQGSSPTCPSFVSSASPAEVAAYRGALFPSLSARRWIFTVRNPVHVSYHNGAFVRGTVGTRLEKQLSFPFRTL